MAKWNPSDEQPEEPKKPSKEEKHHTNNLPSDEEVHKVDHDYEDPYDSKADWEGK